MLLKEEDYTHKEEGKYGKELRCPNILVNTVIQLLIMIILSFGTGLGKQTTQNKCNIMWHLIIVKTH